MSRFRFALFIFMSDPIFIDQDSATTLLKRLTPAFYTEQGRVRHISQQRMLACIHSMITACSDHPAYEVERDQSKPPIRSRRHFSYSWDWVYTNVGEVLFSALSQGRMTWVGEKSATWQNTGRMRAKKWNL